LAVLEKRNHSIFTDPKNVPELRGGDCGRRTATRNIFGMQHRQIAVLQNGTEGQQVRIPVQHNRTINACDRFHNRHGYIENAFPVHQVMQLVFCAANALLNVIRQVVNQIGRLNQFPRATRIIQHNQQPASPLFRQIERSHKQAFRELGTSHGVGPELIFALGVCEPPPAVPESEDLYAIGDDFHFPVGGQDHAHMTTAQRGPAVSLIKRGTGHW
jgi:hypothetical protein